MTSERCGGAEGAPALGSVARRIERAESTPGTLDKKPRDRIGVPGLPLPLTRRLGTVPSTNEHVEHVVEILVIERALIEPPDRSAHGRRLTYRRSVAATSRTTRRTPQLEQTQTAPDSSYSPAVRPQRPQPGHGLAAVSSRTDENSSSVQQTTGGVGGGKPFTPPGPRAAGSASGTSASSRLDPASSRCRSRPTFAPEVVPVRSPGPIPARR